MEKKHFYITHFHGIEETLRRGGVRGTLLVSRRTRRAEKLIEEANVREFIVEYLSEKQLDRLCGAQEHRGVVLHIIAQEGDREGEKRRNMESCLAAFDGRDEVFVLVLDQITDPRNLGAILRSCDLLGVDLVLAPAKRSAQASESVVRTSSGASVWVPLVTVPNTARAIDRLKKEGFWVYGADMKGDPLFGRDLRGRVVIVLGGEGPGLRPLLKERCDALLSIPTTGHIDSLNVSVAASIFMYEGLRQRGAVSERTS